MLEDVKRALRSVVMITVTPFDAAGEVDGPAYRSVLRRTLDAGIDVVTPNGNTSEFYSLTAAERDHALDLTVAEAAGRALVVAGVGYDVRTAADSARTARAAGAQAIMIHQPVHPYLSAEGWVDYHRAVADAVPELGVVCYLRSPHIPAGALAELARVAPNFVGVKYAVPDPVAFGQAVTVVEDAAGADRLVWICGLAETWAPFFWPVGAQGFTSGLANVTPGLSLELLVALQTDNRPAATALWRRLKPFEDLRAAKGSADNVSVVKEALAQLDLCTRTVRPPISELPTAGRAEVSAWLKSAG
ncbi:dihydrodipicolinate synthase family protein [Kutzneria sp. 744]|uniref:dihydrodipicolinate synthase family protein n=1 Tax=Kutzneria sp. (strain 744) TaxID=345341 RepID=UPI0003EEB4FE|nr:dihydrodipicolinate synthase family protein [Kutzneria sp. 744]EWM11097.1 dihydrodipicolinate synthase [Kutzneria sp. 744]